MKKKKIISKNLIIKSLNVQIKQITIFIENKNYSELLNYLEDYIEKYTTKNVIIYIYKITKALNEIINTGKYTEPDPAIKKTSSTLEAIDLEDYALALENSTKFNEENGYNDKNNILHQLLVIINQEIAKTNNKSKLVSKNLSEIIDDLTSNKINDFVKSLKSYLKSIAKENYEFLILDLIKISLLSHDETFKEVVNILESLTNGNYNFSLGEYILQFYNNIAKNNFNIARIYLDILNNSKNLNVECVLIPKLTKVLLSTESALQYMENIEKIKEIEEILTEEKKEIEENLEKKLDTSDSIFKTTDNSSSTSKESPAPTTLVDYYNKIPHLLEIAQKFNEGADINLICYYYGLNKEQTNIAILIIAREYFLIKNNLVGNELMKKVRSNSQKSQLVQNLIKELNYTNFDNIEYHQTELSKILKRSI